MPSRNKALLLTGAVVLTAHAALLWRWPASASQAQSESAAPVWLQTRTVALPEPEAVVQAPVAVAAPKPAPAPAPKPKPRPKPKPAPVPAPTPLPASEPEPLPSPETVPEPIPESEPSPPEPQTPAPEVQQMAGTPKPPQAEPEPEATDAAETDPAATAVPIQLNGKVPDKALPVKVPEPVRLEFEAKGQVKGFEYSADAQLLWQHSGGEYVLTQSLSMFLLGTRAQTSKGRLTDEGLSPQSFEDKGRKSQSAQFDWAEGKARYSGGTPEAPIAAGMQDRVSVFMQLASMIAADPGRYPAGTLISLTTSSARHASRWSFKVVGEESLRLPVGVVPTLRLEKLPIAGNEMEASLWLATEHNYLPVRIRLTQGADDYVDLRLKSHGFP